MSPRDQIAWELELLNHAAHRISEPALVALCFAGFALSMLVLLLWRAERYKDDP